METGTGTETGGTEMEEAEDGRTKSRQWRSKAREQVHLKQKIRELPALLKHGLTLRKRSVENSESIEDASASFDKHKGCSDSLPCAGRALRNAFLSHGPYPVKDRVQFARILRRSYVGVELVQWLTEQCAFIQCRRTAAGVWQAIMELGILLSVDHRISFEDSNTYYQFSFEECHAKTCEFQDEGEWQNGVRLLLQLVPYVPVQTGMSSPSKEEVEVLPEECSRILQVEALERLTSTVQKELAIALARKAKNTRAEEDEPKSAEQTKDDSQNPAQYKQGGFCALRNKEDVSRLEMVQKLAKDGCRFLQTQGMRVSQLSAEANSQEARVSLKEHSRDVLVLQRVLSAHPASPASGEGRQDEKDKRYVVMSGTPERILEHLLSDLQLDGNQEMTQCKEADMLLDDFLLTYLVFMSTSDLCQALLGHYCAKKHRGKEEGKEALYRKRKVLHLVSQWTGLYRDFLREEEHVKIFMKTLYRYVLDDLYEFPSLEKDLKEFQKLLRTTRRHTVDEYSPHRKNKVLFHQTSVKENWLQSRGAQREKEVFCHVYVTVDSYFSVKIPVTAVTQEVLDAVADRMEEKLILQPHDMVYMDSLSIPRRLLICRKDFSQIMSPLTDNTELQQRPVRMLSMNTWDVAVALTNFDWSLFNSVHEQELVYYTVSRQASGGRTAALELLLQRCNEVQLWVMTEVLLCSTPAKRVQLLKKFVKIAAHCKAQRNLNSFFAIIMGLNTAAVSRLSQTWEKVPGKFRKLFSELEMLTDPSMNHKVYRDTFKKMKPPKIPFMPLLLKDITFIHEGNKTFLDNLVNFEKLHMIADAVRLIRHCQMDHMENEVVQKESPEVRSYISCLHIIDNQQTLFELSHRLEPRV
ncbi:rap guanine nucleotide exchange factor 5b isoform X2 [Scleropages formosus]|uniref:rap guanine nucleotide exchange factor 5b isoform X2 n=1 Tax=Scleropages formosus TaxID=113540 RepID=UPI0010FAA74F|nr:rap guanine nucleotide exchange factor 5-like isoform X2 [Scleropages formosus]